MNIHRRFTIQFLFQFVSTFLLFFLLIIVVWAIIGFSIIREKTMEDLAESDGFFIERNINIENGNVHFNNDIKTLAREQNGWLLVLTKKGKVIGSFQTPEQIVSSFDNSQISPLLLLDNTDTEYSYWDIETLEGKSYIVIFAQHHWSVQALDRIKNQVNFREASLNLSDMLKKEVDEHNGWVQLINVDGKVLDSYGEKEATKYEINKLLELTKLKNNHSVATHVDDQTNRILLVGNDKLSSKLKNNTLVSKSFFIITVLVGIVLIFGTFWYGHKFGSPLLSLMKWIKNLGEGHYTQPVDPLTNQSILYNKKGKLKKKFRLYKDLITILSQLTETLKANESQQARISRTRDEWISGISHDLKTPLASISGYANMLESDHYSWNEAETREFSSIIAAKSEYMKGLLEDLTLTYRLKNESLPIMKEGIDITEFIRRTIIQFLNNPENADKKLIFHNSDQPLQAFVDPKWFQRVMDNLIANAIKHNPPGTNISISIFTIEDQLFCVNVEDDGIGMDKDTIRHLFSRYYRGTNTTDSENGTGLGMAITKQLIQLHGGSINVQSEVNRGTKIRVMMPVL
ncbi:sensor histidine kinase [Aquibacillus kalidii]|uniref:sensor histidine kinase n=1 Tax=Aquibacillus kalidii TaxID=2762597 RepID=UPI001646276F|nr:HAMP domain-containing sensor histidine kinase [Aquibacillus kalidii]